VRTGNITRKNCMHFLIKKLENYTKVRINGITTHLFALNEQRRPTQMRPRAAFS
jgi:hypothetical protein